MATWLLCTRKALIGVLCCGLIVSLSFSGLSLSSYGALAGTTNTPGLISISFDDGYQNTYDYAFPLMESRGIVGTFYIETSTISDFSLNNSCMSISELETLQNSGNEIGSHSVTHPSFTDISDQQIAQECIVSKQILQYYGFSANNFAYPYGVNITSHINSIVTQYFRSARTDNANSSTNPFPTNQSVLIGYPGETGESSVLNHLKSIVDTAISTNTWAIIYFHNILPNVYSDPYTVSTQDFSQFLDYVVSTGVRALAVNQALDMDANSSPSPSPNPLPTSPLGQTQKGNTECIQPPGVMVSSRFTALTDGPANNMSVYVTNIGSTSTSMKCAIYKDSDQSLLGFTEEKAILPGFDGWQTFSFSTPPDLICGASYSLVAWFASSNLQIYCDTGSPHQSWYASQNYGTFPTGQYKSLSNYNSENLVYSFYATLDPQSAPSPSPTPSPSPSPTPSPSSSPTPSPTPSPSPTPTQTPPPTQLIIGQSSKGASGAWQPSGTMIGSRFTSPTNAQAANVSVYIANPSGTSIPVKCAIFGESDMKLLAVTEEKVIPTGFNGWQTFNTITQPALIAGSSYSLVAWFGGGGCFIYYNTAGSHQSWYASQAYGNFPTGPYTSLSNYNQENLVYSLYATLNSQPSPSPTPSPSPSPTPSPSSSPTPSPTPSPSPTPTQTPPPTQLIIGQSSKGASGAWQPSGTMIGSRFTSPTNAQAANVSVYIANPSGTSIPVKCAIYQESNKSLIAVTEEKTVNIGFNGWLTFNITSQPSMALGASYSLVVWFGGNGCLIYYNTGSSRQSWYTSQTYGTFPTGPYNTLNNYNQENLVYSLYASFGS